jgi:hypothetical protein
MHVEAAVFVGSVSAAGILHFIATAYCAKAPLASRSTASNASAGTRTRKRKRRRSHLLLVILPGRI